MAIGAAVGESGARESAAAGAEAARESVAALGGAPDLVIVFATAGHDQRALVDAIRAHTRGAALIGCTGSGIITRSGSDEGSHRVAVLAVRGPGLIFRTALARGYADDPRRCARELAAAIPEGEPPRLGLVFPDGLTGNASALLDELAARVPAGTILFGGAAGEMQRFERTYQYLDDEVTSDAVAVAWLGGALDVELGVSHGCTTLGIEHVVTDAEGGLVRRIDDRPAWDVMREYVDEPESGLSAHVVPFLCLAQELPGAPDARYGDYVMRVPLRLDEATGALFFPGELPVGERLQMARRDVDDVVRKSIECARAMQARRGGATPAFVLQADCTGRGRLLFGERVSAAVIRPTQACFGDGVPWIGFHSYGEIAPVGGRARYHNYTMALAAVYAGAR